MIHEEILDPSEVLSRHNANNGKKHALFYSKVKFGSCYESSMYIFQ